MLVRGGLSPESGASVDDMATDCPELSTDFPDGCSDNSDLCLYNAWDQHTDQLLEAGPVPEPRCYLWPNSRHKLSSSAPPPQACLYTTTTTTPPPATSQQQVLATAKGHSKPVLYGTPTDTSRSSSSCSSSSLSSANSKCPLNRNSAGSAAAAAATGGGCGSTVRRLWLLATNWPRRPPQALRLRKMLLKRRSLFLAVCCLILISCTIVSLAISRQVSAARRRLTERQAEPQQHNAPSHQSSEEPLEFRSLELVDLIECGKTFAAIKTRLEAQVARSIPIHHQRPSFLITQSPQAGSSGSQQEAAAASKSSHFILVETKGQQEEEPQDEVVALDSQEHLRGVDDLKAQLDSAGTREAPPALVAQPANSTPVGRMLASDADAPDPVEEARKAMQLHESSYNRTLIDCFFVDTEKRFEQRVALEDNYRMVASTRSVPLKHMIAALIECRNIDWKRAPSSLVAAADQPAQLTPEVSKSSPPSSSSQQQQQQPLAAHRQQLDLISSFMATILRNQPSVEPAQLKAGISSSSSSPAGSDNRRGSYSSMGLSMVSGIVPNTLWCGLGDRAANYSQLGPEYKVDSCCRAHDHCPIRLRPLAGDYGLFNWSVSTRSHCDCDQDFNQCLRQINSTMASLIRTLYFRLVGTHCIAVSSGGEALSR